MVAPIQCSSPRASIGLSRFDGVHRAFGGACANDRVQFVDEQNDLALGLLHFFKNGLQTFLEFAAKLGARNQRAHVERHQVVDS